MKKFKEIKERANINLKNYKAQGKTLNMEYMKKALREAVIDESASVKNIYTKLFNL